MNLKSPPWKHEKSKLNKLKKGQFYYLLYLYNNKNIATDIISIKYYIVIIKFIIEKINLVYVFVKNLKFSIKFYISIYLSIFLN